MTTPKVEIPELLPVQDEPEATVNSALRRIDAIVSLGVISYRTLTNPPGGSGEGDMHVVATPGGGLWAGHDDAIAYLAFGQWQFIAPFEGLMVWSIPDSELCVYTLQVSPSGWTTLFALP